ncbi:MAG: hypothetical protein HY517_01120 [Candidatus Aenigmarchaeota archaeon]|nr:hypothetical protein [Candidatus Aenigmarchaeota archaeon]
MIAVEHKMDKLAYELAAKRGVSKDVVDCFIKKRDRESRQLEERQRRKTAEYEEALELYKTDPDAARKMLGYDPYDC